MTDLSAEFQALANYRPKHKVRFVTSASLFDGHDAAINIMRRILQGMGAEVIHLGHNRSVDEVVTAALQEDVQGIAISSYQGGHVEYFKYMVDLLRQRGGSHIQVFGGGGGVIVPDEIAELHAYGVTRIYSPQDGQRMGLQGMIGEMIMRCDQDLCGHAPTALAAIQGHGEAHWRSLAQLITALENQAPGVNPALDTLRTEIRNQAAGLNVPVVGITGTGGAGKSSLTDELIRRIRLDQDDQLRIAVISIDPSRRKSGGALLGDRIRMNAISPWRKLAASTLGSDPDFAQQNSGSDPNFNQACKAGSTHNLSNQHHTTWSFGELPELMEISKGGQSLIGFPALVDLGDAVSIEVFDEPDLAATKHRAGRRRLFALQIKDALKYLEKNIPDLQKMTVAYMLVGKTPEGAGGGTSEELKQQILDVALERAFLLEPLPNDEASFKRRVDEGRGRLTLIANEVARLAGGILLEFGAAARKIKDTKNAPDATADCAQQLQRLMPKHFMAATPWPQLQHYGRYLKAITLRLDKYRADPSRDAQRLTELKPLEQKYWRLVAERKGQTDARMLEFRWLLEELRVSFFAQELRTPQPVSIKRLEKVWAQLSQ